MPVDGSFDVAIIGAGVVGCATARRFALAGQLHLTSYPSGSFRTRGVDNNDGHFALRTDDFEGIVARLIEAGFKVDAPEGNPMRMMLSRSGAAGFPQLYVIDPDRNIVEVNGAV